MLSLTITPKDAVDRLAPERGQRKYIILFYD